MLGNVLEDKRSKGARREIPRFSAEHDITSDIPLEKEQSVKKEPSKSKTKHKNRQKETNDPIKPRTLGYTEKFPNTKIDDEFLFDIMSEALPATTDPDLFYYAMYRNFPKMGTQEEFSEMFPKLAYKFATDGDDYLRLLKLEHWKYPEKNEQKEEIKREEIKKEEIKSSPCKHSNSNEITNGLAKIVYVGESAVAGRKAFIGEDAQKDAFIGEFTGEFISKEESKRRRKLKTNYLLALPNCTMDIDATGARNVLRFVSNSKRPNCYIKVLDVNGEYRVGFFAKKNIHANEELTYDFSSNEDHAAKISKLASSERVPKLPARQTAVQKELACEDRLSKKNKSCNKKSDKSNGEDENHLAGTSA